MEEPNDFDVLVRRLRSGDEEAARELILQHEGAVRRYIRVRLTDPGLTRQMDSIDICQSVMADFFVRTALGQFELKTPAQLVALLTVMARNRVINHAKKHRTQRRDIGRMEASDVNDLQVAAEWETPSQIVAGRELLDAFRARLAPDERDLADRRSRGESWTEIALATGGSPDALRVKLARAVERVSRDLGLDDSRYE
jgi:RNA polymerase sigma factor (sigma-70 family)